MFVKMNGRIWYIEDQYDDVFGDAVIVLRDTETNECMEIYAADALDYMEEY